MLGHGAGDALERVAEARPGQHLQRGDGLIKIALNAAHGIFEPAPLDHLREQFGAILFGAVDDDGMQPLPFRVVGLREHMQQGQRQLPVLPVAPSVPTRSRQSS